MSKVVSSNSDQVIVQVSNSIIALAKQCITKTGQFTIALSGGNTPELLYQYLINEKCFNTIDLSKIFIFFSDERYVAHDDNRSNYGLAKNKLLNFLDIPVNNIFPVDTSFKKPQESAENYQNIVRDNLEFNENNVPEFDLILLGMGTDGHTASLFPESDLASANDILVGTCYHKDSDTHRISFTFPLINAAKNVYIIAIGVGKFSIINDIKNLQQDKVIKYPIQNVNPDGQLTWFLDKAAEGGI